MHVNARPVLTVAAALALCACGGNPDKEALRAYEAGVENLMAEDGRISAQLKDIREDLITSNAAASDQTAFTRDQALPFYRRFREAAAKAVTGGPRLQLINKDLLEYVEERVGYLESIEAFFKGSKGGSMERLQEIQVPWEAAQKDLQHMLEGTGGKIAEQDVAEALGTRVQFMERVYGPFQRGQVDADAVEKVLRGELLPRLARVAERTKGDRAAEGGNGIIARWAAAELAFYQELAAGIPQQDLLQKAGSASGEHWKKSVEVREKYLTGLRAYRESLR
jgi:hypothetical protein